MGELDSFIRANEYRKPADMIRYVLMAFRPVGIWLTCLIITVLVAIPCVLVMIGSDSTDLSYSLAMAILTGVIASGFVSIALELANNYRRNYKRLLHLHKYLDYVGNYEEYVDWCKHGRSEESVPDIFSPQFSVRQKAVAELMNTPGLFEPPVRHLRATLPFRTEPSFR